MNAYVVVVQIRGRPTPHRRAEVVEARTPDEAVQVALEGASWETEDGNYDVHVAALDSMEQRTAMRETQTLVTVKNYVRQEAPA